MLKMTSTLSEVDRLTRVLLKHPRDAFVSADAIAAQWKELNFAGAPSLPKAVEEYDAFIEILQASGAQIDFLPPDERVNLDSIYVRDASVVCARGVILCRMGKRLRSGEPAAQKPALRGIGIPIVGEITEPGRLEGGEIGRAGGGRVSHRERHRAVARGRVLESPRLGEALSAHRL